MSASTTPLQNSSAQRSVSRNRRPSSRPTTPLRPSSRSSLREGLASTGRFGAGDASQFPLEALEPAFVELSDSMADLESNFEHLQLMHDSLARFSESFASFLYGLNMNAFCVDFPEAPISESFKRARFQEEILGRSTGSDKLRPDFDAEATFMTTDTSFVDNPPTSSKSTARFSTPAPPSRTIGGQSRGNIGVPGRGGIGRGAGRGARGGGLARGRGRGVR
ncbi:MAG: DASH complex subunit dam1 [Trichoglossum hirsutum]|nr:MAG: DASH complex subunit dam1 [Trichoglossum hirsutum]